MAQVTRRNLLKSVGIAVAASTMMESSNTAHAATSADHKVLSSSDREVGLIPSGDPSYAALMGALFPGLLGDAVFHQIQPVSALLHQTAGPDVKAFTVSWHVVNGQTTYTTQYYHAAPVGTRARNALGFTVITGEVPLLAPSGYRLVTPFFSWTPGYFARHPQPKWKKVLRPVEPASFIASQLSSSTQVKVSLDAAIFSDFNLFGQDTFHTGTRFAVRRNAEHDEGLYAQRLLNSGMSVAAMRTNLLNRSTSLQNRLYGNRLWYANARKHQAALLADQLATISIPTFTRAVARLVAHPKTVVHAQA